MRRMLIAILGSAIVFAACGGDSKPSDTVAAQPDPNASPSTASAAPPGDGEANPADIRDLVTMIYGAEPGCAAAALRMSEPLSSFEQLRDYTDTAVVVTFSAFRFTEPKPDESHPLPGEFEADVRVENVLGGRFETIAVGDTLTLTLLTRATAEDFAALGPNLRRLEGSATRFMMFLFQVVDQDQVPVTPARFTPIFCNDPPGLLAEWPGDGRFTEVYPTNYWLRDAVARGEAITGTTSPPVPDWVPDFEAAAPIGWTVEQVAGEFVNPTGEPLVAAPNGWEQVVENRLAPEP